MQACRTAGTAAPPPRKSVQGVPPQDGLARVREHDALRQEPVDQVLVAEPAPRLPREVDARRGHAPPLRPRLPPPRVAGPRAEDEGEAEEGSQDGHRGGGVPQPGLPRDGAGIQDEGRQEHGNQDVDENQLDFDASEEVDRFR